MASLTTRKKKIKREKDKDFTKNKVTMKARSYSFGVNLNPPSTIVAVVKYNI